MKLWVHTAILSVKTVCWAHEFQVPEKSYKIRPWSYIRDFFPCIRPWSYKRVVLCSGKNGTKKTHLNQRVGLMPRKLYSGVENVQTLIPEPSPWSQQTEAVDHDRRSPPAASSHQKHGVPEVLQYGTVVVHTVRSARRPQRGLGCPGSSQGQVGFIIHETYQKKKLNSLIDIVFSILKIRPFLIQGLF